MAILRAALGLSFFLAVGWLLSSHKKRIEVRIIVGCVAMQVLLALLVLKLPAGEQALRAISGSIAKFLSFSEEGARLVFGAAIVPRTPSDPAPLGFVLAFRALPTIIFFSAFMAILYHLGVMQIIIFVIAKLLTSILRVSGAESLAMAANIFVGQTEAPLVIRPYISKLTRSELMSLMTGGFATIAGSVLAVYMGLLSELGPDFAGHLLAASVMSAPAAFCMAKLMMPETEESATGSRVEFRRERTASNLIEAAANGTQDGLKLYLNVLAMLIAFTALVAVINWPLGMFHVGERMLDGQVVPDPLTLQRLLGWVFSPVAWLMGVGWDDCQTFGSLLGIKLSVNEFVAFQALHDVSMGPRSQRMAAYALCGFANFASIGIQIGGISPLAPERQTELSRLAPRAMVGGACASWMTATIAGAFLDG